MRMELEESRGVWLDKARKDVERVVQNAMRRAEDSDAALEAEIADGEKRAEAWGDEIARLRAVAAQHESLAATTVRATEGTYWASQIQPLFAHTRLTLSFLSRRGVDGGFGFSRRAFKRLGRECHGAVFHRPSRHGAAPDVAQQEPLPLLHVPAATAPRVSVAAAAAARVVCDPLSFDLLIF